MSSLDNIASRLRVMATKIPDNIAIAQPVSKGDKAVRNPYGKRVYRVVSFKELDQDSDRIARAMIEAGLNPGMRIALMVRQGIDFITLVFALYKAGAVLVLIDPGMGTKKMLRCLREVKPDGFVAIPAVHAVRRLLLGWFPKAKFNVTVGHRWFWGGLTLDKIRKRPFCDPVMTSVEPDDPAAIIFTSGSTGPAKGVLYTHRIFNTQVEEISERYQIDPGQTDLAAFPFFGLFNAGMGTTAVIPDMDSTHPASVDPELFLEAADDWKITQSFGSPALWKRVVGYCKATGRRMETLERAIIAGAPVSFQLLRDFQECISPTGLIYTPYGATESLPVASISSDEILKETAEKTERGAGICVGKRFSKIRWCVIPVLDGPIMSLEDVDPVSPGTSGELAVTGPQVTKEYVTRLDANLTAKMRDKDGNVWHRIGDVGYLDDQERFWFCGRKAHRVESEHGPFYSIPCESIANHHPKVSRSALVGIPAAGGKKEPVIIVEPKADQFPESSYEMERLQLEVLEILKNNALTSAINRVLIHPSFPVDVRHNAKINRELLALWAERNC